MRRPLSQTATVFVCLLGLVSVATVGVETDSSTSLARQSSATSSPVSPRPITNDDVVKLVQSGLSEDLVIATIRSAKATAFDTTPDSIIALKGREIPERVIAAMIEPTGPASPPASANDSTPNLLTPSVPAEVGVYVKRDAGRFGDVSPEVVNWKTGGMLKAIATAGVAGPHVNGWIANPSSRSTIRMPGEFIIVVPDGTAVEEYQLLRLNTKGDRREFKAFKTGMLGLNARSGLERDVIIAFEARKVSPRTFAIQLTGLVSGEYGFLPPGVSAASIAAAGKMYTFRVE